MNMLGPTLALALLAAGIADGADAPPAVPEAPASTNAPPARLDIVVRKNINKNKTSSVSTQESYVFQVTVRNEEVARAFKDLRAELYVLSVDKADESMFNVIVRQAEAFDLPLRAEQAFETNLFYVKHTESSGTELAGYVVLIHDEAGRVIAARASRASFANNLDRIRTAPISTSRRKAFRLE